MEKNDKDLVIKVKDDSSFCFKDAVLRKGIGERKPQGYVEIYEQERNKDKQLVGKSNLVVNMGREWLLSRAFNVKNANIEATPLEFISWMGLGDGGALIGDPFNPIPPTNLDINLASEVPINATTASYGDFRILDGKYYKHPIDSVTFQQDNDNNDSYLILEIVTTIGFEDANDYILSEAGLYTNELNTGGAPAPFHLYSRVTFPSTMKNSSRQLIFVWYIYF